MCLNLVIDKSIHRYIGKLLNLLIGSWFASSVNSLRVCTCVRFEDERIASPSERVVLGDGEQIKVEMGGPR